MLDKEIFDYHLRAAGAEVDKVRCARCGRCTATLVPFKSLAVAMTQEAQDESCQHASALKHEKHTITELI